RARQRAPAAGPSRRARLERRHHHDDHVGRGEGCAEPEARLGISPVRRPAEAAGRLREQAVLRPDQPRRVQAHPGRGLTAASDVSREPEGGDQARHRRRGGPDREDPGTLHAVAGELSAAARPLEIARGARSNATAWLLIAPSCLALVLLFVVPIAYVLLLSLTDPRLSIAHYQRIFPGPVYTRVMVNTFVTSLIVTALCLVIGYPIAYVMARRPGWISTLLLTVVAMSFWTGFLVRTYAWLVILGSKGPVAAAY